MSIRVKVKRTALIASLEAAKAKIIADYTVSPQQIKDWQTKTLAALAKMTKDVQAGRDAGDRYDIESKPVSRETSSSVADIERSLRVLRLSTDEYLTLTDKSDYYRYI